MSDLFQSTFYKYHHITKHTVESLFSNQHMLDWKNEPNPFRVYEGSEKIILPADFILTEQDYFTARQKANCPTGESHPSNLDFISKLLYFSMAISAIKQITGTEHRWALRVNPSSGNLHPTETHLFVKSIDGLDQGLYHYSVKEHALEQRAKFPCSDKLNSILGIDESYPLTICLTSIFERESWKYRQRAFRYCLHDLGHAQAAILFAASLFNWQTKVFAHFPDNEIKNLMGLNKSDERPMMFLALSRNQKQNISNELKSEGKVKFFGKANVLTKDKIDYPEIEIAYKSTCIEKKPLPAILSPTNNLLPDNNAITLKSSFDNTAEKKSVYHVIRKRRSAVDMDGRKFMAKNDLGQILQSTGGYSADYLQENLINLYLYIHKVEDIESGLYYFNGKNNSIIPIKEDDERPAAKFVSCFQDIAAHSCLTISMIANLDLAYNLYADRCYRYVHFEAGYIGQFLYLTSFALGYDATGIGCFIDDEINHYLNLPKGQEVIYNFTIGKAIVDRHLTDLPSYSFAEPNLNP